MRDVTAAVRAGAEFGHRAEIPFLGWSEAVEADTKKLPSRSAKAAAVACVTSPDGDPSVSGSGLSEVMAGFLI